MAGILQYVHLLQMSHRGGFCLQNWLPYVDCVVKVESFWLYGIDGVEGRPTQEYLFPTKSHLIDLGSSFYNGINHSSIECSNRFSSALGISLELLRIFLEIQHSFLECFNTLLYVSNFVPPPQVHATDQFPERDSWLSSLIPTRAN